MAREVRNRFLEIGSKTELAEYLGIPLKELTFFAYSGKDFYKSYRIPKRNGQDTRLIEAPAPKLKMLQRKIAHAISEIYTMRLPDSVHGFVEKRSIATNAVQHVCKREVVKIDLEDFFPSITASRVHGLFKNTPFRFPSEVVNVLTNLVCYHGSLPQGAPTSPILSNMICLGLDKALLRFARDHRMKYTRYADDITFSSTIKGATACIAMPSDAGGVSISEVIEGIIVSNGFRINMSKAGIFKYGARQVVTGIVVNKKCNFRRSDYRYLRNLFHFWSNHGAEKAARRYVQYARARRYYGRFFSEEDCFDESAFVNHIYGLLSYYSMIIRVNKRHSRSLQMLWTSLNEIAGVDVPEMVPERSILQTDCDCAFRLAGKSDTHQYATRGTAFVIKGGLLVTARHCFKDPGLKMSGVIYDDDSVFDVTGAGCDVLLEFEKLKDNALLDSAIYESSDEFRHIPGLASDCTYNAQIGEVITAYGYADGLRQLRRIEARIADVLENEIVVDRAFIKGMSGGPVMNVRGDVIGVITKGSGDGTYDRDGRFVPIKKVVNRSQIEKAI